MYGLQRASASDTKHNARSKDSKHAPNGRESIKALGRAPRQAFLLDLVLEVSRGHVDGKG